MKKVLLSIFAVAALASCFQNEELVGVGGNNPIAFDNAYVGGATKAIDNSFNNDNLDLFQVYGTVTANGATSDIFRGVEVRKANGVWAYDEEHTQYWMAGNTYSFKAVVAGNEAGATEVVLGQHYMPTAIKVLDASQQKDVLYSEVLNVNYHSNLQPVRFIFKHLLAKAKVTVKNVIPTPNGGYYKVESVYLKDAYETATYTIGDGWASQAGAYDLQFGNIVAKGEKNENADAIQLGLAGEGASNYERLIIPQNNCELTIVVSYQYYDKNNFAQKTVENQEIKTIANIEAGKAYNFVLTLAEPGEKIEFDVEDVTEWDEYPVYEGKTVYAAGVADLDAAINNPDVTAVVLTEDINLNTRATAGLTIARDLILDGNGHKIVSAHDRAINVSGAENVTFKNLVIEATGERAINLIQGAKKVTIENVTAAAANYTVNVAASAPDANVTISNSHLTGLNTVNIAGANAVVTINDSTIICNDQSESENYYAIAVNKDATNAVVTVNGGEIIVNGDSYAGSVSSNDASLVLNGTETHGADIRIVNFAIVYGNNYYSFNTLAEAIEVVKAGETIELVRDITDAEPMTIPAGKTVVLNLNGHTISGVDAGTASYALITNKGNLTIQGTGKLELSAENNRGWNAYSSVISNQPGGTLTVNGGTIEHLGGTDMAYGIDNLTNGKGTKAVTIVNGGTVKSTYRAIRQFLNGVEATNELYVNGGVIEGANKSIWMQDPSKNANTGKLVVEAAAQLKGNVYLTVTAGSTEWPVEVSIASAALVGESTVLSSNVPAGYTVLEQDDVWTVINAVPVATENALHTALASGNNVVLTEDITFETGVNGHGFSVTGAENMTIDLNGKTLTSNLGNNALRFKIGEGNNIQNTEVTITVKNGKVVSGSNNWCAVSATGANGNKLTLNLEDIEIENNKSGDYAVKAWTGATINAKNVTVTSNAGGSFYAVGGEIVLDGCSAVTTSGSAAYMAAALGISGNGKMTVNSGTYTATPSSANGQWVIYLMSSGGELVINGGTFNGTVATNSNNHSLAYGLICADTGAKVTLNGGTYNSNGAILDMRNNTGQTPNPTALLAGGDYSNDPRVSGLYSSNLITVADGKTVAQGTNGRWTVE